MILNIESFLINTRKIVVLLFCIILLSVNQALADNPNGILGVWINAEGDGYIEISKNKETFEGTIVGDPDPDGADRFDINNPEPALRSRPLLGLKFMSGFRYEGANEWTGGKIYDPNSGNTYHCTLQLTKDGTLKVRGYIGIPLFGRTETWTRQTKAN